jgi:hypothetical protein
VPSSSSSLHRAGNLPHRRAWDAALRPERPATARAGPSAHALARLDVRRHPLRTKTGAATGVRDAEGMVSFVRVGASVWHSATASWAPFCGRRSARLHPERIAMRPAFDSVARQRCRSTEARVSPKDETKRTPSPPRRSVPAAPSPPHTALLWRSLLSVVSTSTRCAREGVLVAVRRRRALLRQMKCVDIMSDD